MVVIGLVNKFNLEVVDNCYVCEGLFLLFLFVYGLISIVDLFIFNLIEFWIGKNLILGKLLVVVDIFVKVIIKVNG